MSSFPAFISFQSLATTTSNTHDGSQAMAPHGPGRIVCQNHASDPTPDTTQAPDTMRSPGPDFETADTIPAPDAPSFETADTERPTYPLATSYAHGAIAECGQLWSLAVLSRLGTTASRNTTGSIPRLPPLPAIPKRTTHTNNRAA